LFEFLVIQNGSTRYQHYGDIYVYMYVYPFLS